MTVTKIIFHSLTYNKMSKVMKRPGGPLGVTPTNSQKLQYIASQLGLGGIAKMQGTTFNLFDTVLLPTSATGRQTLNFFSQTQNKSRNFSNFQNGTLGAGEAMVIEYLTFYYVTLSATNLSLDATTINAKIPLSQVDGAIASLFPALESSIANITIANSRVVKDLFIFENNPNFNPRTSGIELGSHNRVVETTPSLVYPTQVVGQNSIPLESPPVLPPNQKFEITLELPPVGTMAANSAIVCAIGRFGSIFSAKTPL